jgi:hypothetical protein
MEDATAAHHWRGRCQSAHHQWPRHHQHGDASVKGRLEGTRCKGRATGAIHMLRRELGIMYVAARYASAAQVSG